MDIKIAFLLFCAVLTTECQYNHGLFAFPGSFSGNWQSSVDKFNPIDNINGRFRSTKGPENPSTQQSEFDQSSPVENSNPRNRDDQEYFKKPPLSSKISQKLPATSSNVNKPLKTKTEDDRRQQFVNNGPNQELPGLKPSLVNQDNTQSRTGPNYSSQQNRPNYSGQEYNLSGPRPSYSGQEYNAQELRPNYSNQQNNPGLGISYFQPDYTTTYNGHDPSFPGNRQSVRPPFPSQPESYSPFQSGQQSYGPNNQNRQPAQKKPVVQRENEEKFEDYKPITEFSWNLFKRVSNPQQPNFVISPLSPQHLLSYLASGAAGETKDEIVRAIRYKSPNQLNSLVSTMLREPGNKELQLASALFVSNRIGINPEFQRNLAENTKIIPTDFSNAEKFNREYSNWVAEKTKGALKNVRVKPDPSTRMLMTSAVYFKGEWIFKLNSGGIEDFYVTESTPVKVPMMKLLKKLPYGKLKNGDGEWISLPYNSNDSMVIILPREGLQLEELIQNLNVQDVFDSMNIDNYGNVTLTLPKFKVESKTSLVNPLQQLGIRQLFSTNAQLPNIFSSNEPLTVSSVLQQASLEVNEEGSIATSLTAVGVVALSFSPPTPDVVFNVNRPFIAMIIDRKNNFPYFIAKISNPAI